MIKNAVSMLLIGVIAIVGSTFFVSAAYASDVCSNVKNQDSPSYKALCDGEKTEDDASNVVKNILNTVFIWIGIVSTVVVIVGGVFYMLSQGDPGKVARAKNTILYALIGLIVSLLSFAIVNFVLEKVAGK
jgi:phosphoglycerol transferase MdoB-like AlkP superfamily enzyme